MTDTVDIVERLRDDRLYAVRCNCSWPTETRQEAADEIERLRAENARLRVIEKQLRAQVDEYRKELARRDRNPGHDIDYRRVDL